MELVQGQEAYGEPPASLRALVTIVTTVPKRSARMKVERPMWAQLHHGGGAVWWKRTYHFMVNRKQQESGISEDQGRMEPQTRCCDPLPPARPTSSLLSIMLTCS